MLWSNNERSVLQARQPTILNGIDEFVCRQDLADRCLFVYLPPIAGANRRVEGDLWREFQAEAPVILGGLLDAIMGGLAVLPSVRPPELPRMADFACLGEAIGRGLGWPEGTFLTAYSDNRRAATVASLEDSLIVAALFERAQWGELDNWTCSASEMLEQLAARVSPKVKASVRWPKTPRSLADELRRVGPQLRMRGISVTFTRTAENRLITIDAAAAADFSRVPGRS